MVPLCDLKQQYHQLKTEIDAAIQRVVADGRYILGPCVQRLEAEVAAYCGCQFAVGVASGTDALHLALRALGIGPGDEVITSPFTFVATTEAIALLGARPVFVDIDANTCNLDPRQIESAITPRTRAILPVHLYGQPCPMDPILDLAEQYGLFVVEDCAQAMGATYRGQRVGSFGDAGCLSFFPSKNLGCLGDGGMVVTNNHRVLERVEMLRRHGGKVKYHHTELGLNSRLDEIQAAVLLVKLPHLERWNRARWERAVRYNGLLSDVAQVQRPAELSAFQSARPLCAGDGANVLLRSVYHQYTIQLERRDEVLSHLKAEGIQAAVYYPVPLHLQEVHADLKIPAGAFPNAETVAKRCLSLPMYPELTKEQQVRVTEALRAAVRDHRVQAA